MEGEDDCVLLCKTFVNSCWEAPSTKKTALRWHWKLGYVLAQFSSLCLMNYALQISWTAKQRLQVPIPKKPQSVQLLERDMHVVPKLEQVPLAFLVISFLPGRIFWTCSYSFFSVLTYGLPGGFVQITMYHLKRLLILLAWVILSALCHQEFSDLNARFLKNMDSESKQQFPPS